MESMDISLDSINESFESTDFVRRRKSKAAAKQKRSTGDPKSFACPHCPKTFMRRSNYQKHLAHHTNKINKLDCNECNRSGMTELGLRMHKKFAHPVREKTEMTINNNKYELPAIDGFKIFESKKPTSETYDCVQAEIPWSPYSDDCSNFSVDSAVSSASSSSSFEMITYPDESTSNMISSTVSESSVISDIEPVDFEEETHDFDKEILKILKNEMEKNFVDVVLSFSEY